MRKMVKCAQNMRKVGKYARAYLYAQSGQICAHMRRNPFAYFWIMLKNSLENRQFCEVC